MKIPFSALFVGSQDALRADQKLLELKPASAARGAGRKFLIWPFVGSAGKWLSEEMRL